LMSAICGGLRVALSTVLISSMVDPWRGIVKIFLNLCLFNPYPSACQVFFVENWGGCSGWLKQKNW
jgi:hypothetical protein